MYVRCITAHELKQVFIEALGSAKATERIGCELLKRRKILLLLFEKLASGEIILDEQKKRVCHSTGEIHLS